MFRRAHKPLAMAPVIVLPSGNVEVVGGVRPVSAVQVPTQAQTAAHDTIGPDGAVELDGAAEPPVPAGWSIRGDTGSVLRAGLASRAEASRLLGVLAAHGDELPLLVYDPDGKPTGERLG